MRFSLNVVILVFFVFTAFFPAVQADFVVWDDNATVYNNPFLNPATPAKVAHFWTSNRQGDWPIYRPVVYSIYALLTVPARRTTSRLSPSGDWITLDAWPFHLTNLVLHTVCSLFVWALLRRWLARGLPEISVRRREMAALLGALGWAVHPIQVEAVAWVTGLTEILAGLSAVATLWFYESAVDTKAPKKAVFYWGVATLCFLLALVSKPSSAILPLMALSLDWWREGNRPYWWQVSLKRLIPWFVLSLAAAFVARAAEPLPAYFAIPPLWMRPLIAGDALIFYARQIAFPFLLGADYGRSPHWLDTHPWMMASGLALVPLGYGVWLLRRERLLLLALALTLTALMPVVGFVPFRFQIYSTVADRYFYLPMLGISLLGACSLANWGCNRRIWIGGAAIVSLWAILTYRQTSSWQNDESLWKQTLRVNSSSTLAHTKLAALMYLNKDYNEALQHYQAAINLVPQDPTFYWGIGNILEDMGKKEEAKSYYVQALQRDPTYPKAHNNLGSILAEEGHLNEAIQHWNAALAADPKNAQAHFNLGIAEARNGQLDTAIIHFKTAVHLDPSWTAARQGLQELQKAREQAKPR